MVRIHSTSDRRGFTLTEILVAVGVLLAIVVITGRIFKVATDVTSTGQATVDIMQEAAAIEARIREDIANMTGDGFLVIRSVEVPNDVNVVQWDQGGRQGQEPGLLNPVLDDSATIRCDQLCFFVDSPTSSQIIGEGTTVGSLPSAQSQTAFVTYGHGIQLPGMQPYHDIDYQLDPNPPANLPPVGFAHDPDLDQLEADGEELVPWRYDNPGLDETDWLPTIYTNYRGSINYNSGSDLGVLYEQQIPGEDDRYINATQPDARQWILARHTILLADDDEMFPGGYKKRQYLRNVPSAQTIFPNDARPCFPGAAQLDDGSYTLNADPPVLTYGRVDVAAIPIDEVREMVQTSRARTNPRENFMRRCMHYGEDGAYDDLQDVDQDGDLLPEMQTRDVLEGNLFSLDGSPYLDQRFFMKDVVRRPRVERTAPSMSSVDQALTNHALGTSCSSFSVEWTYGEGAGGGWVESPVAGQDDQYWYGVNYSADDSLLDGTGNPWLGQRWFGLRDIERGVMPYAEFYANYPPDLQNTPTPVSMSSQPTAAAYAVDPYAIDQEFPTFGGQSAYEEYWATFGYNRDRPALPLTEQGNELVFERDRSFTPWPSALRITMTINDPQGRLEQGQVYQFVVEIPEQARGGFAGGAR